MMKSANQTNAGDAIVSTLFAAEDTARYNGNQPGRRPEIIASCTDAFNWIKPVFKKLFSGSSPAFYVLCLTAAGKVTALYKMPILNKMQSQEELKECVSLAAPLCDRFIVFRNAIEGNFSPAPAELTSITALRAIAQFSGIALMDYLILNESGFYSWRATTEN